MSFPNILMKDKIHYTKVLLIHWLFSFKINRDVSLQAFLFKYKVFSEVVQYEFEPYRHDNVSTSFKFKLNHTSFGS